MLGTYEGHWQYWQNYHRVTFDGPNRLIVVNPGVSTLRVKQDLYSAWKQWLQEETNSKYEAAFRSIGGDPIGGGLFAGDLYFLINDWKIYIDHEVAITGVVYCEDGSNPFITPITANVVRSTASNLALAYGQTPAQDQQITNIESQLSTLQEQTRDLHGEALGRWVLDPDADTMTLFREDGSVLKVFDLTRVLGEAPAYAARTPR